MLFFPNKLSHQAIFKHKARQVFIPQLFLSHLWTTFWIMMLNLWLQLNSLFRHLTALHDGHNSSYMVHWIIFIDSLWRISFKMEKLDYGSVLNVFRHIAAYWSFDSKQVSNTAWKRLTWVLSVDNHVEFQISRNWNHIC